MKERKNGEVEVEVFFSFLKMQRCGEAKIFALFLKRSTEKKISSQWHGKAEVKCSYFSKINILVHCVHFTVYTVYKC